MSASENPAAGLAVGSAGCMTAIGRLFQLSQATPEIGLTGPVLDGPVLVCGLEFIKLIFLAVVLDLEK
jgi:hypothetical protein